MKRCPDCGRDNADDVLECRFCLADLPVAENMGSQNKQDFYNNRIPQKWEFVVLEGANPRQIFAINRPCINIGRADPAQCWNPEIELTSQEQNGSHYVSRKHAQLTIRENRVYVADLGSLHGTFIEGKGKVGLQEIELFRGDRIRFGKNVVLRMDAE